MTNNELKPMPDVIYAQKYYHQDDGSLMIDADIDEHPLLTKYIRADLAEPQSITIDDMVSGGAYTAEIEKDDKGVTRATITRSDYKPQPVTDVKWEMFCDKAYFDMWAVRPIGDKLFASQKLFHVMSQQEAQALCDILNSKQQSAWNFDMDAAPVWELIIFAFDVAEPNVGIKDGQGLFYITRSIPNPRSHQEAFPIAWMPLPVPPQKDGE